jgi:hypothetical protein
VAAWLYQQKRDFKKTAEPSCEADIAAAEYPRFVIQKPLVEPSLRILSITENKKNSPFSDL